MSESIKKTKLDNIQPVADEAPAEEFVRVNELAEGQQIIVAARWVLVVGAMLLALWSPDPAITLRTQIILILAMAAANFYIQAQTMMKKAIDPLIICASSAVDLTVITLFVIVGGGFRSTSFAFYFPAILAYSVVFPRNLTIQYSLSLLSIYGLIGLTTMTMDSDLQIIVVRLIMMAGVAVCGNMYQTVERDRREAAIKARQSLLDELSEHAANATDPDDLSPAYGRK